jgi:hypothetical protein
VGLVRTDVSEKHIASIFRLEEAIYSFGISADFERNMQRYILDRCFQPFFLTHNTLAEQGAKIVKAHNIGF